MTLKRTSYRTYSAECDVCGDILETDESDFLDAVATVRQNDWVARRCDGVWTHTCPSCAKDEIHGMAR